MSSNKRVVAGGLALILSAAAQAQTCPCGDGTVVAAPKALSALLLGKTLCAVDGKDSWQEYHQARGVVVDYKRGPNHPTDPSKGVATYRVTSVNDAAVVSYDYGGGQLYRYTVCQNAAAGTVNLCGARNIVGARLLDGQVPCNPPQANQAKPKGL